MRPSPKLIFRDQEERAKGGCKDLPHREKSRPLKSPDFQGKEDKRWTSGCAHKGVTGDMERRQTLGWSWKERGEDVKGSQRRCLGMDIKQREGRGQKLETGAKKCLFLR